MKIKSLALTTAMAIGGTIATGSVMPAMAITFNPLYFGEDINANGGANAIPNSLSAATNFLSSSNLISYTTQNFDSVLLPAPSANSTIRALTPGMTLTTTDFPGTSSIITTSTEVPQTGNTTFNFSTKGVRFNDTDPTPIFPLTTPNPSANGRFAISGTQYYEVGNGTFTVTFSNPMAALGFYATDVEDLTGMVLTFDNDPTKTLTIPRSAGAGNTNKSALYYGFVAANPSEVFTSVTFGRSVNDSNDKFGLDDLTFATPSQVRNFAAATSVPEPLTMMGTLLGGGAVLRLRKKLKTSRK
jgi:hypothetical protein